MSSTTVIPYENPDAKDLRARVEAARARLAEVEAAYTIDKAKVDSLQASLFQRLRTYRQERDRLRLIVDYRRQFLAGVLRGDEGEAERVKQAHREAEARNEREYEETAQTLAAKKELTAEDEAELGKLWKSLVKLYHPDRFAHEPDKLDTYGKLTAAINRAKDNGDFATLRQIANDPHGFILKQGWASLDFRDEEQAKRLAELYASLMAEIRNVHAAREKLRASPEFELYQLTTEQPAMLDAVVEKQTKLLEAEIAELTRETERLAAEIGKLTGHPAPGAEGTPRASGPADEREAPPPPPPPPPPPQEQQPRQQEQPPQPPQPTSQPEPPKREAKPHPSTAAAEKAMAERLREIDRMATSLRRVLKISLILLLPLLLFACIAPAAWLLFGIDIAAFFWSLMTLPALAAEERELKRQANEFSADREKERRRREGLRRRRDSDTVVASSEWNPKFNGPGTDWLEGETRQLLPGDTVLKYGYVIGEVFGEGGYVIERSGKIVAEHVTWKS
jgi:hypothetical protein